MRTTHRDHTEKRKKTSAKPHSAPQSNFQAFQHSGLWQQTAPASSSCTRTHERTRVPSLSKINSVSREPVNSGCDTVSCEPSTHSQQPTHLPKHACTHARARTHTPRPFSTATSSALTFEDARAEAVKDEDQLLLDHHILSRLTWQFPVDTPLGCSRCLWLS